MTWFKSGILSPLFVVASLVMFGIGFDSTAHAKSCLAVAKNAEIEDEDWDHIEQSHCIDAETATNNVEMQEVCAREKKSQFKREYCAHQRLNDFAQMVIRSPLECKIKAEDKNKVCLEYRNKKEYIGFDRNKNCEDTSSVVLIVNTNTQQVETMYPGTCL